MQLWFWVIGLIATTKNYPMKKPPNEKATKAYKLFDEGKKPVEVAIRLGLPEKEATRYYTEYWRLKRLNELHSIYKETKGDLSLILKLYSLLEKE
jgi:hypothetical protein